MHQINGLTDAELATFEDRAEVAMVLALRQVMNTIADRIAQIQVASALPRRVRVLVAADGSEEVPGNDSLPPAQPYVSPDDLATIPTLWPQAVEQMLMPIVAEVWQGSSGRVYAEMQDATGLFDIPSVSSIAAEQYLAQARNTFEETVESHLWSTARDQMLEGFEAGESIPQIAQRLRDSADLTARQAIYVARTQVLDASNAGSMDTARASGLALRKSWIDTNDPRTRPTHVTAGAQYGSDANAIPLADPFIVGGFSCDRPHDPVLPIQERARCRCTTAYSMTNAAARSAVRDADAAAETLPGQSGGADLDAGPVVVEQARPGGFDLPAPPVSDADPIFGLGGGQASSTADSGMYPVTIRPSLTKANSVAKVHDAFLADARRITGGRVIGSDFTGMTVETAREHAEGVLRTLEAFPDAELSLQVRDLAEFYHGPGSAFAVTRTTDGRIMFSPQYSGDRAAYVAQLRYGSEQGALLRGGATPPGVAAHEAGHAVHKQYDPEAIRESVRRLILDDLLPKSGLSLEDWTRRELGSYANENINELIAVALGDALTSGAQAAEVSRRILAIVQEAAKKGKNRVDTAYLPGGNAYRPPAAEAVASVDISKLTVKQLQALAKSRGIPYTSKTRKADLVSALQAGPAAPVDAGRALRAELRARAALVKVQLGTGRLLAHIDELLNKGASDAAIRQALDVRLTVAEQVYDGASDETIDALAKALASGDRAKLKAAVTRRGTAAKIKPIGRAGGRAKYDPDTMAPMPGSELADGQAVEIVTRGTSIIDPTGKTVVLEPAQVIAIPTRVKPTTRKPSAARSAPAARQGQPESLPPAQFDADAPRGSILYRGVTSPEGAAVTRRGELGGGDYGRGIYFGDEIGVAQSYMQRYAGAGGGIALRAYIKPGAKIVKVPDRVDGSAAIDKWADANGVDVVVTRGGYRIVRNPDVLVFDERNYDIAETVVLDYRAKGYILPDGEEYQAAAARLDALASTPRVTPAQARQAKIDDVRTVSNFTAKVDQLLADGVAGPALRRGIEQAAALARAAPAVRDELLAAADTPAKLRRALASVTKSAGLRTVARAGRTVKFNRQTMRAIDGDIPTGADVVVVRPGYTVEIDGERVQLLKAVVELA